MKVQASSAATKAEAKLIAVNLKYYLLFNMEGWFRTVTIAPLNLLLHEC